MSSTEAVGHECRICGSPALHEFERFRRLERVTSDSRPWKAGGRLTVCQECGAVQKLVDKDWLGEIGGIYRSYAIYHQANGQEQPIFTGNGAPPQPRSLSLMRWLNDRLRPAVPANILDFGCGTGVALRTYSEHYPKSRLYGAELSTDNLRLLQDIPGFSGLFTCPPSEIPLRFDLITLIHALEHVLDPVGTLLALAGRLDADGVLFVQVPDAATTPYDLVIVDHLLHFTLETLRFTAQRAGCDIAELTDSLLPKELSLVARSGTAQPAHIPDSQRAVQRVSDQIDWLFAQIASARALAERSSHFGLFGTSISGTWLAGVLGDRVSFFVDEDKGRIGRRHMGRPILAGNEIPADSDVFVPLIPPVAASVAGRLSRPGVRFHAPPSVVKSAPNHAMVGHAELRCR